MKTVLINVGAFVVFTVFHFIYTAFGFYQSYGRYESLSIGDYMFSYTNAYLQYRGLSIGLLGFFAVYVLRKYLQLRDIRAISAGGIIFLVLFITGYLLCGIDNSTGMFDYFLNKFGSIYISAQHVFLFITALGSVTVATFTIFCISRKRAKNL